MGNEYLPSKKGFNSQVIPTSAPNVFYECGSGHSRIDASSAQNTLVYDVMP